MPTSKTHVRNTDRVTPPARDQVRPVKYLTKATVAERLDVSVKTVTRLIKGGQLRYHKIAQQVRIADEDLDAFMAVRRH